MSAGTAAAIRPGCRRTGSRCGRGSSPSPTPSTRSRATAPTAAGGRSIRRSTRSCRAPDRSSTRSARTRSPKSTRRRWKRSSPPAGSHAEGPHRRRPGEHAPARSPHPRDQPLRDLRGARRRGRARARPARAPRPRVPRLDDARHGRRRRLPRAARRPALRRHADRDAHRAHAGGRPRDRPRDGRRRLHHEAVLAHPAPREGARRARPGGASVNVRSSLTARMVMLGAALAVVVGLAIGAMLLTIADMRHDARMARRSAQVLAAANLAEKEVLDLETGARGFALTREERFLAPWRSARTALPRQMERLATLVADNPAQESLAQELADDARGYVDEYSVPLVDAVRRQDNPPAASEGKRRIDAMRAQFARFDATEQRLADTRRAASDHAAARAMTLGVIVLVAGVALLLGFAAYLGRAVATPVRRVAEAADRLAAGDLGARVPVHGRDELARLAGSFNAMGDALQEN